MILPASSPYTASEIAVLLGWETNRVWKSLRSVTPSGVSTANGRNVRTYTFDRLTREIQDGLRAVATHQGFAGVEPMRRSWFARWTRQRLAS